MPRRLHEQRLHAAASVGAAEHVLDIGCGTGRSTRTAGHAAAAGTVLGVDISAPVLELARRLTDREGLRNVSYGWLMLTWTAWGRLAMTSVSAVSA
jgi:ubiquinone/menaquinone biosynthesis C-methylase UbiE